MANSRAIIGIAQRPAAGTACVTPNPLADLGASPRRVSFECVVAKDAEAALRTYVAALVTDSTPPMRARVAGHTGYHSTSFQTSGSIAPGSPIPANKATARLRWRIASSLRPTARRRSARLLWSAASLCRSPISRHATSAVSVSVIARHAPRRGRTKREVVSAAKRSSRHRCAGDPKPRQDGHFTVRIRGCCSRASARSSCARSAEKEPPRQRVWRDSRRGGRRDSSPR